MISIGDFVFPKQTTAVRVQVIEAKSKVRKEIRIQSLIRGSLDDLLNAAEAFDRGECLLSLTPGRFYMGRRRVLQATSNLPGSASWVDFLILTQDKYERSSTLHSHTADTYFGRAVFSLFQAGNWKAPLLITLQPSQSIHRVEIQTAGDPFVLESPISDGDSVWIDSEKRVVEVNGNNLFSASNEAFPFLVSGANTVSIFTQPAHAAVQCTIQYRDFWV